MTTVPYEVLVRVPAQTQESFRKVTEIAAPGLNSVVPSHDDAGRLCNVTCPSGKGGRAILYDIPQTQHQAYLDYYAQRYPLARVEFASMQPPPPPTPKQFFGFQQQRAGDFRDQFIDAVRPDYWKLIGGMEEAHHLLSIHPGMKIIYRHCEDDWRYYVYADDKHKAAGELIGKYRDSLEKNADVIHGIEGLNEWIATNDYATLEHASAWVQAYIYELDAIGMPAKPVMLNIAVGNPQSDEICEQQGIPSQLAYLDDAIRAIIYADGYAGYHAYHGARAMGVGTYYCTLDGPEMHYYSMRALLDWDPHFAALGLKPKYLFTEGGTIYVGPWGGMPSAYAGWKDKDCFGGDLEYRIGEAIYRHRQFCDLVADWNETHENRACGAAFFLHGGNSEWDKFDWAGYPSERLAWELA